MNSKCSEPSCSLDATYRQILSSCEMYMICTQSFFSCSRCRQAHYCCQTHQKLHWVFHKTKCLKYHQGHLIAATDTNTPQVDKSNDAGGVELRQCRCMFCGIVNIFSCEEEAISHMRECSALQEQLMSPDQFTIPKSLNK